MSELPLEKQLREEAEEEFATQKRIAAVIEEEHKGYYRRCFSSIDGMKVLAHMLSDMGLPDEKGGSLELKNYVAKLMNTCGFTDTPFRMEQFVEKCFEIQQTERKQNDKV